jgi:hypothetical protein
MDLLLSGVAVGLGAQSAFRPLTSNGVAVMAGRYTMATTKQAAARAKVTRAAPVAD